MLIHDNFCIETSAAETAPAAQAARRWYTKAALMPAMALGRESCSQLEAKRLLDVLEW